ncbi:hypothetical protein [Nonomuraea antri]|uniref:hypothetical protein n=1 Tax=Nonomuraea antri TaxID=2730852 RepID=UPI001C2B8106|nr:hypothetical protein [Nonomuraea antri]
MLTQLGQDVTIEPYLGSGSFGPVWGPPVTVRALVDNRRRRVRSASGTEVISESTIRVQLTVTCPVGSRVTLPDGRTGVAITNARHDGGTVRVPSHLEVALT